MCTKMGANKTRSASNNYFQGTRPPSNNVINILSIIPYKSRRFGCIMVTTQDWPYHYYAVGRMSIPMFPFPAPVHHLIAPTKKACCRQAMHNNHRQKRTWRRLHQVNQAKDQSRQPNPAYASPTPLAQSMIERISCCTYQPSPANPPGPLRHGAPYKSPEKQLFNRSIDKQVEKSLQKMIANGRPAKPGTNDKHTIHHRKGSHEDTN